MWTGRLLIVIDAAAAFVLGVVIGYAATDAKVPNGVVEPRWVSAVTVILIAVPIVARRRWPLPAFAVGCGATLLAMASGLIPVVAMGAPITAVGLLLYMVASATPPRRSVPALATGLGGMAAVAAFDRIVYAPDEPLTDGLFGVTFGWLILVTAWTLGFAARERRRHAEELAERRTREAVAEERLRIARELHDIVAHSMSLIAVKAGIGNHVAEQHPAQAREALRVIEATSRGSLTEMRHLLGVLRSEVDDPALAPAPGPDGIPALVERARSAGVTVALHQDEAVLPGGIGLSVYRIVQEALTNVVKHAARARCAVSVEVREEDVSVEVTNDGPVTEQAPGGHGLIGMRERVAVYGGTFEAGPRPAGGWRVSAVLPR